MVKAKKTKFKNRIARKVFKEKKLGEQRKYGGRMR